MADREIDWIVARGYPSESPDTFFLLKGARIGDCVVLKRRGEEPFVVVGYANQVEREVNVAAFAARGIPILRRCSGGGTVVQGPGCLNYALVLRITPEGPTRSISAANQFIMERNREAIQTARSKSEIRNPKSEIQIQGHTDLTLNGLKFSGNSQRRRREFLLFHGTFLLNFDLQLVDELLPMPSQEPDYRQRRGHGEFLTNLPLPAESVKSALQTAWVATGRFATVTAEAIAGLAARKYALHSWNFKT